jgi:hypothetical protein
MTRFTSTLTALACLALLTASAQAATIAVETFDYDAGQGELAGKSGGFGLTGSWGPGSIDFDIEDPVAEGWDDGSFGSPPLFPIHNMARNRSGTATRGLSDGSLGAAGETYWFAAMVFATDDNSEADHMPIQLTDGANTIVSMSRGGDLAVLKANNGSDSASGGSGLSGDKDDRMAWLVTRVDYDTDTQGDVYLWVAPDFDAFTSADEPLIGDATLSLTDATLAPFNAVAMESGNRTSRVGQLRLATSWDTLVIPEPASLALLGLGGVLIAGRRRS